jgi:hypothetical protein
MLPSAGPDVSQAQLRRCGFEIGSRGRRLVLGILPAALHAQYRNVPRATRAGVTESSLHPDDGCLRGWDLHAVERFRCS